MVQPPDKPPTSGKVTRDARGNAVWSWVSETGKIAIDSTSRLLKRLEVSDLKLEGGDEDAKPDLPTATPNSLHDDSGSDSESVQTTSQCQKSTAMPRAAD